MLDDIAQIFRFLRRELSHSKIIDDEKIRTNEALSEFQVRIGAACDHLMLKEVGHCHKERCLALLTGEKTERARDVGFANACWTDQDQWLSLIAPLKTRELS